MKNQNKKNKYRNDFDKQVEWVLARMPKKVVRILEQVPIHVEDQPSRRRRQELKIEDPREICGYFSGIPYGECNTFSSCVPLPNYVKIFRRGIIEEARDEYGKVRRSNLRRQIQITILHELAHLHGMNEEDIVALGYG